jgi:hypothetical protein
VDAFSEGRRLEAVYPVLGTYRNGSSGVQQGGGCVHTTVLLRTLQQARSPVDWNDNFRLLGVSQHLSLGGFTLIQFWPYRIEGWVRFVGLNKIL